MGNQQTLESIKAPGTDAGITPPGGKPELKARPFLQRRGVIFIGTLALLGLILFLATVFIRVLTHESTDDAFIDGHVISIAPKISGRVATVDVTDNQQVKKGDVLVEIDPRDYEAMKAQKKAAADVAQAKLKSARAMLQQARQHIKTLMAGLDSLKASAAATRVTTMLSHSDLKRYQEMARGGVVSAQDFEHSKSASDSADANLESKNKEVDATEAYASEAEAQMESAAAQEKAAEAEVNQALAEFGQADLQWSYATIRAPEDGRVTTKAVEAGDYVQAGQALMALVPREVWVTANYKETQITDMRPGQPALVEVDAYPDRKLRAHVDSIQAGSGARFSLLPPENATGNFVKVVQRVPVKIVFDEQMEAQRVLGPGMSAVPEVEVRGIYRTAVMVSLCALAAGAGVITAAGMWGKRSQRNAETGNWEPGTGK
jgi:membrane fusion protein (multidrug efflux system)